MKSKDIFTLRAWTIYIIGYILFFSCVVVSINTYDAIIYKIHESTPEREIWTYSSIVPQLPFYVNEPMKFASTRWSKDTYRINMLETLRCEQGTEYVTTIPTGEFTYKKGFRVNQIWTYGDVVDYMPKSPRKGCFLESCQYLNYYGIEKTQCFSTLMGSGKFFDITIRE